MIHSDLFKPETTFSLDGKVALVTGAAGHLGTAMSTALAHAGAFVYLNGRNREKLAELSDTLIAQQCKCSVMDFDIKDETAIRDAASRIESEQGGLNILINNAHSGKTGTLESSTLQDYANAHEMAVGAPAILLQALTPLMTRSSSPDDTASVVNIASMYGMVSPDPSIYGDSGHNSPPYYGAAKGGLLQFTRYAAVHLAQNNIRVNAISPGAFPKEKVAETMPALWQTLNEKSPMKRTGRPQELRGVIQFLASPASSYVTGVNIPVDGGWTAW